MDSSNGDAAVEGQTPDTAPDLFELEGAGQTANDAGWRNEVAARLERYRSRRKPRAPRYPTLRLPFDAAESSFSAGAATYRSTTPLSSLSRQNIALQPDLVEARESVALSDPVAPEVSDWRAAEPSDSFEVDSNVIEFPRSSLIPTFRGDELAEPVIDRPRIVEAPEVMPPPPALGGILIETAPTSGPKTQDDHELFVRPATLARRLGAGAMDGLILLSGLAAFGVIFERVNPLRPPLPLLAAGVLFALAALWATYEFLFVTYIGGTPGWRIARLRLAKFDGSSVRRSVRRWRVLASFLSAFSIGLGFFWSVLDEHGLCWHDRITHTCLVASDSHR